MLNIFKKKITTYKVTYKFVDSDEIFTENTTSKGLAFLNTDWAIEIIEIVKI